MITDEEWPLRMRSDAIGLVEQLGGDVKILDNPADAINWLENELSGLDTRDYSWSEILPFVSLVMSFLAEVVISLHGAHWVSEISDDPDKMHYLVGGRLKSPVRIGRIVMDAFSEPHPSVVSILNSVELEGLVRVF